MALLTFMVCGMCAAAGATADVAAGAKAHVVTATVDASGKVIMKQPPLSLLQSRRHTVSIPGMDTMNFTDSTWDSNEILGCTDVANFTLTNATGNMGMTITYPNVGTIDSQSIDLVVEAAPGKEWTVNDATADPTPSQGLASLNFKAGVVSSIQFKFVKSKTDELVTMANVALTLYDIDSSQKGPEKYTIFNPTSYALGAGSEEYYTVLSSSPDLTVESIQIGNGDDNPSSALDLDAAQIGRSLTVTFSDMSTFFVDVDLQGVSGNSGRNLLFSLNQVIKDVDCPTPSPTPLPTPQPTPGCNYPTAGIRNTVHYDSLTLNGQGVGCLTLVADSGIVNVNIQLRHTGRCTQAVGVKAGKLIMVSPSGDKTKSGCMFEHFGSVCTYSSYEYTFQVDTAISGEWKIHIASGWAWCEGYHLALHEAVASISIPQGPTPGPTTPPPTVEVPMCTGCGARQMECWSACASTRGYCDACNSHAGSPGACCRMDASIDPADPDECRRVPESSFLYTGYHMCVLVPQGPTPGPTTPPPTVEVPMCTGCGARQMECWSACASTRGYCDACNSHAGSPGACCRMDASIDPADPDECRRVPESSFLYTGYHMCVLVPQDPTPGPTTPPPTPSPTAPTEAPTLGSWFAGQFDESCDTACQAQGLVCSEEELAAHNGDVDTSEEVLQIISTSGGNCNAVSCSVQFGSNPDVPNFKPEKCHVSASSRDISTFNCAKQPSPLGHQKRRLCYCVEAPIPSATTSYAESPTPQCYDVQPPSNWGNPTCESQAANTDNCAKRRSGELNDGYCHKTCGVCGECYDVKPPSNWGNPTCESQLANTDKCAKRRSGELNDGYCHKTCGVCVEAPTE